MGPRKENLGFNMGYERAPLDSIQWGLDTSRKAYQKTRCLLNNNNKKNQTNQSYKLGNTNLTIFDSSVAGYPELAQKVVHQ